jgi:hypothetical protein
MEDLLNALNNLTPVIAVGSMAVFMTLKRWLPYWSAFADLENRRSGRC